MSRRPTEKQIEIASRFTEEQMRKIQRNKDILEDTPDLDTDQLRKLQRFGNMIASYNIYKGREYLEKQKQPLAAEPLVTEPIKKKKLSLEEAIEIMKKKKQPMVFKFDEEPSTPKKSLGFTHLRKESYAYPSLFKYVEELGEI